MAKHVARIAMFLCAAGLLLASTAGAYKIPGIPKGSPGGPPTTPKGGSTTSKGDVTKCGDELAGYTNTELASLGSLKLSVTFPRAGTIACSVKAGSKALGSGSATDTGAGTKSLTLKFTASGKSYLRAHSGKATKLTVAAKFTPTTGTASTSTTTVTTAA